MVRVPLWLHALVLAGVLLVVVPFVGVTANLSADEGPAVVQAESLADGEGWTIAHPFPEVDPAGAAYPFEKSVEGADGFAPFGKHPAYPLLLAAQPFGVTGMVLLSAAGTVVAAALAALLARRMDPALDRWTLWLVGLGSPLLFDSQLVIAHTLGAAAVAGAVLLLVVADERRAPAIAALAAAPLVLAGVLRTEAALFGLALALVLGLVWLRRRTAPTAVGAAAAGIASLAALRLDVWLAARVVDGTESAPTAGAAEAGFLAGRIQGAVVTWLLPGYELGLAQLLSMLALVAVVMAAVVARQGAAAGRRVVMWTAIAAGLAVARLAFEPGLVPGLLVAFPLVAAGAISWRRDEPLPSAAVVCGGTAVVFSLAVLATQYATGGSGEWGGRYFALGVPVATPVLLLLLHRAGERLDAASRRGVLVAGSVLVLATGLLAVLSIRHVHERSDEVVGAVVALAEQTDPGDGGAPVVVATEPALPRLAWAQRDDARFLLVEPDRLDVLADRLEDVGIQSFVVVERGDDAGAATGAYQDDEERSLPSRWAVRSVTLAE
jgi:hypothetical protein